MNKFLASAAFCTLSLCAATVTHAQGIPFTSTYTVSGTPGDYTLDFTVTNNLPADTNQNLYYFGIEPAVPITNSPATWVPFADGDGNPIPLTENGITYNTGWITDGAAASVGVPPGISLSGFEATFASVPAAINFEAFAYDTQNTDNKTGYPGIATSSAPVPEASQAVSFGLLLALGMVGLGVAARKKKAAATA